MTREKDKPTLQSTIGCDIPKSYKGIYAMHKYWSKKPFNLVANYISRFSKPGDIVLDPFCGSGVTVIESVRTRRKAIGFDINPVAIFVTRMGLEPVDIKSLEQSYKELEENVKTAINSLYKTKCPNCENENGLATHYIWNNEIMDEVWVSCRTCKISKVIKKPDSKDIEIVELLDLPKLWYPTSMLFENTRINAKKGMTISDLFTNRALHSLSLILNEIEKIRNVKVKNALKFCFSAAIPQASRMVFVIRRRGKTLNGSKKSRTEVGSWVIGYWIPSEHFEVNVWRCFDNRFKRILRGKKEINNVIPRTTLPCTALDELYERKEAYYAGIGSATKLPIEAATVDYVFTDPPHGNRMPYLELSLMWNSWLKFKDISWEDEVVISEAKSRKKNVRDYRRRIMLALEEIWRVLKPEKYMSIVFNSLDDETWLSFLNSCLQVGFKVSEIKPLEYSASSVVQDNRKNALKTDFVITCQKQVPFEKSELKLARNPAELQSIVSNYLEVCGINRVQTYDILNHVVIWQVQEGKFTPITSILDMLERRFVYLNSSWQVKQDL